MGLPFEKIRREVISIKEETTDSKYGKHPNERSVPEKIDTGFILLDKPSGIRSKTAADIAKKILSTLGVRKVGYSGTLDPAVTGLLPLGLNRTNKALPMLLLGGKEYVGTMHVHDDLSEEKIREAVNSFVGKITQLPPVRSNVKREYRQREVYYFDVLEIDGRDVLFKTGVESGTYIRKLVHDMGEKLGSGAHMSELRRTIVSNLTEKDGLVTLQDLEDAVYFYTEDKDPKFLSSCIQNIESAIDFLPKVWASDSAVHSVCNGSPLSIPGIIKYNKFQASDWIFLSTLKGELIGLGKAVMNSDELSRNKKGIAVNVESVVMALNTYPRYERPTN